MINLLTANAIPKDGRYKLSKIKVLLQAQIENSLELGWEQKDIKLRTNFPFEFMGIKAKQIEFNPLCPTAS